jgi:hypothetical protein
MSLNINSPSIHVNNPIQVTTVEQTGAAVANSVFGDATALNEQDAFVNAAQQSAFTHQFVL